MYDHLHVYVYQNGKRVGLISAAESLQWMPSCKDAGEFKLICTASEENLALLQEWAILYNLETPDLAAVILAVEQDNDNRKITARGKFTLYRLNQRVCYGTRTVTDAAAGLLEICKTNLRELPVTVPTDAGFTAECSETVEWCSCYEAATQLAEAGGFCVWCVFDPDTAADTLQLSQGVDRTDTGSEAYNGYLSARMGSLTGAVYTTDASEYANVIICAGEAPGENDTFTQYICEVGATTKSAADRHELYVDGSSVKHKYTIQNSDGSTSEATYTEEEYQEAVRNYAAAALLAHYGTQELSADAGENGLVFGTDYNLGDRLPIRVEGLNLTATARVTSVKIVYESTGRTLQPVLDDFEF